MAENPLDQTFERFVRDGDMDALGEVFDGTAPSLFRIALHLSTCSATAEDLVQMTFVTAIRKARLFRCGRPVFPWLLGILSNHARELHRAARPPAAAAPDGSPADPLAQSAGTEAQELVESVIAGLPPLYRDVVRRHLLEGASPLEISHQLSRSPSTVRSQLKRGLAQVRRGLPKGLIPGFAALRIEERGLEEVRRQVMACAQSSHGLALHASAGILLLLVCGLTLGLCLPALTGPEGPRAEPGAAASEPRGTGTGASSGGTPTAAARAALAAPAAPAREPGCRFIGRLVKAGTSTPLSGVSLRLRGMSQVIQGGLQRGAGSAASLGTARSDAEGRFELRARVGRDRLGFRLEIAAEATGLVRLLRNWNHLVAGELIDLGELQLEPGTRLRGTVRELSGRPVASGSLQVLCPEPVTVQIRDGCISSPTMPHGTWQILLHGPGLQLRSPDTLRLHPGSDGKLDLLVADRPRLSGRVVDAQGTGIAGVQIRVQEHPELRGRSDARGAFELIGKPDLDPGTAVTLRAISYAILPDAPPEQATWWSRGVEIRVRRSLSFRIRVLDPQGRPVTAFAHRCQPGGESRAGGGVDQRFRFTPEPPALVHHRTDDTRDLRVGGAWPGWNRLWIFPVDPDLAIAGPRRHWVDAGGDSTLLIRLQPAQPLAVQVLDESGAPLPGAQLHLRPAQPDARTRLARRAGRPVRRAHTDGEGRARIRREPGHPYLLELRATGYATQRIEVPAAQRQLQVRMQTAGGLHGRVQGRSWIRGIELVAAHDPEQVQRIRLGPSGSFAVHGLRPGRYELFGLHHLRASRPGVHDDRLQRHGPALAQVEVPPGAAVELAVQGPEVQAAELRARIHRAGAPAPVSWLYLFWLGEDGRQCQGPYPIDAQGRCEIHGLRPGRYALQWSTHGPSFAPGRSTRDLPGVVTLRPGQVRRLQLDLLHPEASGSPR